MHLVPPPHFRLDSTARSSWISRLPPLQYEPEPAPVLRATLALRGPDESRRVAVQVEVQETAPGEPLSWRWCEPALPPPEIPQAAEQVAALLHGMLRLDEDLDCLYHLTDQDRELSWARAQGAGRLLRSQCAFEDLVKALLLGRYSLSRARDIVAALCEKLGERTASGACCFPSAAALAAAAPSFYEEIGAGPLQRALLELSQHADSGMFYPESLRRGARFLDLATMKASEKEWRPLLELEWDWEDRVRSLLLRFRGFGDRATDLVVPLLGCYDGLYLDRSLRKAWLRRGGRRAVDDQQLARQILHRTNRFLHYRGLALQLLLRQPGLAMSSV